MGWVMLTAVAKWLGVDVGGTRKGFDVAVVDEYRLLELVGRLHCEAVLALVQTARPSIVAIDSPRLCAPAGQTSRDGERLLAKTVCGIRWTPDAAKVHSNDHYAWIVEGLRLYEGLADRKVEVIEVFPTASWTRWHGKRGQQRRSAWTRQALTELGLEGVPRRTNQDQRDAIAAAVTARQYTLGQTEQMGEIVAPVDAW
jgi:predicted nuclease with RNAse H fold